MKITRKLQAALIALMLALTLAASAGTVWADAGGISWETVPDPTDPWGVSWE